MKNAVLFSSIVFMTMLSGFSSKAQAQYDGIPWGIKEEKTIFL
jgi:hypothetical protein